MTSRILLNRRVATLVLASTGAVASGASWGADEAPVPSLPEVIVTAQKRAENIQDVPISVIALSAQELKDSGVTDIKNLTVLTPGLTVTSTTSENSTTARIRGIGTVGDNPGLESSVGIVIDGVYRPRNGVGFGNLGEIEQIEVLEGPQGELFGKNNDAGVISITTKRPSMDVWRDRGGHLRQLQRSGAVSVRHRPAELRFRPGVSMSAGRIRKAGCRTTSVPAPIPTTGTTIATTTRCAGNT